jgi:hypothetical protein
MKNKKRTQTQRDESRQKQLDIKKKAVKLGIEGNLLLAEYLLDLEKKVMENEREIVYLKSDVERLEDRESMV